MSAPRFRFPPLIQFTSGEVSMRSRLVIAAAVAAFPASLVAQVLGESVPQYPVKPPPPVAAPLAPPITVPASLANAFGNSNNNIPFSWSPTQYQQIFDGTEIPLTVMGRLGMRQDEQFSGWAGASVDL